MSKVIDETWDADGERVDLVVQEKPYGSVVAYSVAMFTCHAPDDCTEVERARLAAQAPAMARLLLRVLDREAECLECREGVYWDDTTDKRVQPHLEGCELQATLRAAGVLE